MSITNTLIQSGNTTAIYTAPNDAAITTIIFCNTDSNIFDYFTVYAVPNGSVVGPSTTILFEIPIAPTETFTMDTEKLILSTGDALYAQSVYSNSIAATVSAVNI
jgi:hypothetical protein